METETCALTCNRIYYFRYIRVGHGSMIMRPPHVRMEPWLDIGGRCGNIWRCSGLRSRWVTLPLIIDSKGTSHQQNFRFVLHPWGDAPAGESGAGDVVSE